MRARSFVVAALLAVFSGAPFAAEFKNEDPLESRVKIIAAALRCPVCQGESVYDSHSTVAAQMKELIREQISSGKTDPQVLSFFEQRYGEFILMEPKLEKNGWLLWSFPVIAMFGGIAASAVLFRQRATGVRRIIETVTPDSTDEFIKKLERLAP